MYNNNGEWMSVHDLHIEVSGQLREVGLGPSFHLDVGSRTQTPVVGFAEQCFNH